MRHTSLRSRRLPAVIASTAVAGVVVAGVAIAAPMSAAAVNLPPKTAQQVLALIAKSESLKGVSGTVQEQSNLGLPQLPTTGAGSGSQTAQGLDLLTGTHTFRVFAAGRTDRRIQVLDADDERDLVQHGTSIWTYDYNKRAATHVTVDAAALKKAAAEHRSAAAPSGVTTPDQAASLLLSKLKPSSTVTTSPHYVSVAGRDAYVLTVTPKTTATTVGSITLAIDATTGLPLQFQVFARGTTAPAVQIGYTSVSYSTPAASLLSWTPPKGTSVKSTTVPKAGALARAKAAAGQHRSIPAADRPTVSGTGWSSIIEVPAADVPASLTSSPLYLRASTAVTGGRSITSALVNVLVTTDGRVLAGSVPLSALQAAAAK